VAEDQEEVKLIASRIAEGQAAHSSSEVSEGHVKSISLFIHKENVIYIYTHIYI